jgi:ferritin-like metal-binding protein YciE
VQFVLPQQLSTAELQHLLLVAVNLERRPRPALLILKHMVKHRQLLYDSSSSSVQLVEQLITTAVIREHWNVAPYFAATPAAKQLGLQAVTQLLCLCIQLERIPVQVPAQQYYYDDDDSEGMTRIIT